MINFEANIGIFFKVQSHLTKKTRKDVKNPAREHLDTVM